ncbi:MAG: hypothetical protein D3910_15425, partial [Candidatus Electrothrix sp. ATG2]|nr:hypothetical protein [Candidatus Electrothrix sp. ATG2]
MDYTLTSYDILCTSVLSVLRKRICRYISFYLFSLGLVVNVLITTGTGFAGHYNAVDSPFGYAPAVVIPPFKYGLNNPYTFAEDVGVQWDRSLNFVWARMQPDLAVDRYYWMNERQLLDTPKQISMVAN